MKVLIEIDDKDYADIMSDSERNLNHYERLIKKGIPLTKWHGRLIDADDVNNHIIGFVNLNSCPTIIEADTESEDKE